MKKILSVLLVALLLVLSGCSEKEDGGLVLKVYSWQDYIDDGKDEDGNSIPGVNSVIDDWIIDYKNRTGKDVQVVYDTFETNEVMLNTLKTGKTDYDLVCPSEYAINKMIREGMIEKFDFTNDELTSIPNYNEFASPYIKKIFKESNLADYAVPYMWGTMGFMYDPENISLEAVSSWDVVWDVNYKNQTSLKDSVRDTYIVAALHIYKDELTLAKSLLDDGQYSIKQYNDKVTEIMNRCDDDTLDLIEKALKEAKNNIIINKLDTRGSWKTKEKN